MYFYDNIIFNSESALNFYFYKLVGNFEIDDYCEWNEILPNEYDELTDEEKDNIRWEIALTNRKYASREIAKFELKFNENGRCDLFFGI